MLSLLQAVVNNLTCTYLLMHSICYFLRLYFDTCDFCVTVIFHCRALDTDCVLSLFHTYLRTGLRDSREMHSPGQMLLKKIK